MPSRAIELRPADGRRAIDADTVLNALANAVVAVDAETRVLHVNGAGESLLRGGATHLAGQRLDEMLPADSPMFALIAACRDGGHPLSEYQVTLTSPRIGRHLVNIHAAPVPEMPGAVVLSIVERSISAKIDRQLTHRGAARSVTAMASMLAHEVKNPMSGIRGAAQLLEQTARPEDRPLTRLIRDESDRVCALVDRMEVFNAGGPLDRAPVNIHEVLGHVRALAVNGFGAHLRFAEHYDPSLPPVYGNRDPLVQVFLNLVKNAAEAAPKDGGEVTLSTAYRHGVRFAVPGSDSRVDLPLLITIADNGPGIPDDIRAHLFEPFVTSKPKGSGLGLALVAKIVGDHGGVIEFESAPRRTVFHVMLPVSPIGEGPGG